jgi:adenylate cyclase
MFSLEKLEIRISKTIRNLVFQTVFWYLSLFFYTFLTGEHQLFKIHLNFLQIENIYLILLVSSVCLAILFTLLDGIFSDRLLRFFPRRMMVFLKSLLYFASAFILIIVSARPPLTVFTREHYTQIANFIPDLNLTFVRFLIYFYLSGFLINFFKAVKKKVGRGNFRSWALGMLNKPLEQERIFMFIDMKKSTTLAEKLGHKKFSHLIQDVFNDLSVVDNYHGEIYQYLGDGAIVSWTMKQGINRNHFLKAYFAFTRVIYRRRRYYKRKYGELPAFKAGAHCGKVMVLQVGQIRRDISYNGDTINTAARIEAKCTELRQEMLISGQLYDSLRDESGFSMKHVDKLKLKGKRKGIDIYKVKPLK